MKNKFIYGLVLTVLATVVMFAFMPGRGAKTYAIKGEIAGNSNGKTVYLRSYENRREVIDSTVIKNGRFEFKGRVDYPRLYNIIIVKNDTPASPNRPLYQPVIPVFVENSEIRISAILDSIPQEDYIYFGDYDYSRVNIKGSSANDTYMDFLKGYAPLAKKGWIFS